jgi:hypothetical protein
MSGTKPNIPIWINRMLSDDGPAYWREKYVGLALAKYSGSTTGPVWPSQETIAKDTKLSLRTVRKAIHGLAEQHFVSIEPKGGGKGWSRYEYRLTLSERAAGDAAPRGATCGTTCR